MVRPSGQALLRNGFAAAPRNPVPGFRARGVTIPDAAGFQPGRTRIRADSLHSGNRGLCPSLCRKGLSPAFRTPLRFLCAGGSPQSPFSPTNPPLARLREAGGACFAVQSGEEDDFLGIARRSASPKIHTPNAVRLAQVPQTIRRAGEFGLQQVAYRDFASDAARGWLDQSPELPHDATRSRGSMSSPRMRLRSARAPSRVSRDLSGILYFPCPEPLNCCDCK